MELSSEETMWVWRCTQKECTQPSLTSNFFRTGSSGKIQDTKLAEALNFSKTGRVAEEGIISLICKSGQWESIGLYKNQLGDNKATNHCISYQNFKSVIKILKLKAKFRIRSRTRSNIMQKTRCIFQESSRRVPLWFGCEGNNCYFYNLPK